MIQIEKHSMRRVLLFFLLGMPVFLPTTQKSLAQCCYKEMDLSGGGSSIRPEEQKDGAYLIRKFRLTPKDGALTFMYYSDKEKQKPLFTYTAEGSYTVNEPSQNLPGAFNVAFRLDRKSTRLNSSH